MHTRTLADLAVNESATVVELLSSDSIRRRLLDIGLIKNTVVTCVGKSPANDPIAFNIRGGIIAIRRCDCEKIIVSCGDKYGSY